ncbi:alpha/beta fold hydrolase [Neptunicella marina]|uniref:Dienelactone hydrolase family protein n=1 Tax=Neptunicella marina TaxID=2125989 RepID=A0A8J6IMX0_9ALTE|nr:alpha/beta fold hydrolase [Neptunicella marina]MBC3764356.1 dienelactone hydrolase family protein [Neptunicella marina]
MVLNNPVARVLLAHGAGAGSDSDFMQQIATLLRQHSLAVESIDFPYMQQMQQTGKRRPPDRMPILEQYFNQQIAHFSSDLPLFIGGKSMGGRVATHVADNIAVKGVFCLGYPFHPPGKPEKLRTQHLATFEKPCLILQGEKDTFGKRDEVERYALSNSIQLQFFAEADHSLKPPKRTGFTQHDYMRQAANNIAQFIQGLV